MHVRRVVAAVALGCAVVVASATAASAHAVLLQTDPSPQSTVARPPARVSLTFSESVEVSFGAIRVFDVNGRRVDTGTVEHGGHGSQVVVQTPHLRSGTYTVTWRVVSADGHPVHGGFVFYVGAPSSISPVAIKGDTGAGRVVDWGFGVLRFLSYAALFAIVGGVVFRRWVWTPVSRMTDLSGSAAAAGFRRWSNRVLMASWAVLLVAGAGSVVFEGASVSGLSLLSSMRPTVVRAVLHTAYGHLALVQVALTAVLLVPVIALARRHRLLGVAPDWWVGALLALGAGIAVAMGVNGHARTDAHRTLAEVSISLHLLAAAAWVGGLAAFVLLGGFALTSLDAGSRPRVLRLLISRFSWVALVAVAVLVATGIVNSIANFDAPSDLWNVTYGRVVLAKAVLLLLALALAARHKWLVPRRLQEQDQGPAAVRGFRRTGSFELVVLVGAVACAAGLVALVPGRSLAAAGRGPVTQEHGAGGYTVQVFLDPSKEGANQVHLTFVNPQGLAAAEVTNVEVSLVGPRHPRSDILMRLISPGHFVGDAMLAAGSYELSVRARSGSPVTTSFHFRLRA